MAKGQSFFLDKVILPLLEPYSYFLSEEEEANVLANLETNRSNWNDLLVQYGELKAAELVEHDCKDRENPCLNQGDENDAGQDCNGDVTLKKICSDTSLRVVPGNE
eukprot:TRINITY_DN30364_c0_g1_i1.p1 TRINITY_DN30364_c0_g1~~TRINITY_DN30364_c0_g1_i1.p1  ORF type:complete len:117 (-),score=8.18 TRINITY_DN30364_c0_g1_i1:52-369(-)